MRKTLLALCLVTAVASAHAADPAISQEQFQALVARIAKLEAEAQALRQQSADALAQAQAAQAELEQLKGTQPATAVATTPASDADLAANPDDLAAAPDATSVEAPAVAESSATSNANAFNPAISIILNGSYSHHSLDPDAYARAGFPLAGESGPGAQGLSLGESEI
jgi:TolA-binding protein